MIPRFAGWLGCWILFLIAGGRSFGVPHPYYWIEDDFLPKVRRLRDGAPLATLAYRNIRILSPEQRAELGFSPESSSLVITNVKHDDAFWVAEVPIQRVRQVILQYQGTSFQTKYLDVSHQQIRFLFEADAPVRLYPQPKHFAAGLGLTRKPPVLTYDLVFTAQAVPAIGDEKKLLMRGHQRRVDDFTGAFGTAFLITSHRQMQDDYVARRYAVRQFDMPLINSRPRLRSQLLRRLLSVSNRSVENQKYHVLFSNCISVIYREINNVLEAAGLPERVFSLHPKPLHHLQARGLIDREHELATFEEELFADLASRGLPQGRYLAAVRKRIRRTRGLGDCIKILPETRA